MKTILVPSDFSKNAAVALRYAIHLCELVKANLVVFHCAHISPYVLAVNSTNEEQMNTLIKEDEDFKLKRLTKEVKKAYNGSGIKNIPSSTKIIVESQPLLIEHILEVAENNNCDLIITGTHGATGLNRFFFGSNTSSLISRSEIPVLAIPEKYRFKKIRKIAFASDLVKVDSELTRLVPFAEAMDATIDLIYFDYGTDVNKRHIHSAEDSINNSSYKKVKLIRQPASIEYTLIRQIREYIDSHPHQWLVMFTRERKFWDKLLVGGKTEFISYSLQVPLLSFKKD